MAQTLLALCALVCALILSLSARQATHHRTAASERGEIEVRIGQVGGDLLDFGTALPFAPEAAAPASDGTFWGATSLPDWDGLEQQVDVMAEHGTLPVHVRAEVDAVVKSGEAFVATASASPYRRVRLVLRSEMDTAVVLERIYSGG